MTFLERLNELANDIDVPPYVDNFSDLGWPLRKGEVGHHRHLHHYTSQEAAFQILDKKAIRATDAHFLNDTEEILLGRRALKAALAKFPSRSDEYTGFSGAVRFLLKADEPANYRMTALKRGRAYVVSFSTKDDDLRQWQSYGRSGGVSFGFSLSLLAQVQPDAMLAPVIYASLEDLIQFIHEDMNSIWNSASILNPEKRRQVLIRRYALFTALTKSTDFESENEWRLVLTEAQANRQAVSWRQSQAYAIPYLTLALWEGGESSQLSNNASSSTRLEAAYGGCRVVLRKDSNPLTRVYYDSKNIPVQKSQITLRE